MTTVHILQDGTVEVERRIFGWSEFYEYTEEAGKTSGNKNKISLYKNALTKVPITPGGRTLYYNDVTDGLNHIVELVPHVRSVVVQPNYHSNDIWYIRKISLPYMIFVLVKSIRGNEYFVYFRNKPVTHGDDAFDVAGLPNIDRNRICLIDMPRMPADDSNLSVFIEWFLSSNFTLDHWYEQWFNTMGEVAGFPNSFDKWQEKTLKNPDFVLHLDWIPSRSSLSGWIENSTRSRSMRRMFEDALNDSLMWL